MIRLLADENTSHRLIDSCRRLNSTFPIIHVNGWEGGRHRESKDPVLLQIAKNHGLIIVSFDRRTLAMHAAEQTRAGIGHTGVILFRRSVSQHDFGKQARLLVDFWREAVDWDWSDRIHYLP